MFDAVTAPLSAHMEALLLSPTVARGLDVPYLCLVGGLEQACGLTLFVPQPNLSMAPTSLSITNVYSKHGGRWNDLSCAGIRRFLCNAKTAIVLQTMDAQARA